MPFPWRILVSALLQVGKEVITTGLHAQLALNLFAGLSPFSGCGLLTADFTCLAFIRLGMASWSSVMVLFSGSIATILPCTSWWGGDNSWPGPASAQPDCSLQPCRRSSRGSLGRGGVRLLQLLDRSQRFVQVLTGLFVAALSAQENWMAAQHHFDRRSHRPKQVLRLDGAELLGEGKTPVAGADLGECCLDGGLFISRRRRSSHRS